MRVSTRIWPWFFGVLAACGAPSAPATIGSAAPAFTLTTNTGETLALESCLGEVVVLSFWTTTCAPCLREVPVFNALVEQDGIRVLAVALDADGSGRVATTATRTGMRYPVLYGGQELFARYGGSVTPHTILIDAAGIVRRIVRGAIEGPELQAFVDEIRGA